MVIISPGSRIPEAEPKGWSNTHAAACREAAEWVRRMAGEGFADIDMLDTGREREGRWLFTFAHRVTGVTVELWTHGIDNLGAYEAQCIFSPRVYWNGSSCAEPRLEDFAAQGYAPVMTYRPYESEAPEQEQFT